jgi:putative membrane-bound dehydrogenase-like protein
MSIQITNRSFISSYTASASVAWLALSTLTLFPFMVTTSAEEPSSGNAQAQRGALESIESTRGGRHWIDAKTDPPKSPEETLASFQIEPGVRIELVAAEPLVMDPVAIAFDERGRMFVVEYGDYPIGPPNAGDPPLSRVVMLEDTDGDGHMDQRHVFADRLTFAHSLMPYQGGLLVGAQTEILFLKDTDGDHQADVREVLFSGFVAAHPQMQIGNPRWGLDNWIYFNYGPGEISKGQKSAGAATDSKPVLKMPRNEFRFHPLTMEFGPASGLGQFGNTIDNYGERFFCTNRNPIMTAPISYEQLRRNPFLVTARDHYDVGPSGGDTLVYPLVEMKSNYLSHAGTHTSACGTTAYHGDWLGAKFANSVFVCEPIGHLVTRSMIKPVGATLTTERARPKADFLASSDTWFRPASLATGPDGALYLADMYRLWVEHPKFLPEDIAKRIDWRAGDDRGRIWRIVPADKQTDPRQFNSPDSTADLVALLADANGWRRQLAQRLLVERQAKDAVPQLRELLHADAAFGRLHALWTLDGLAELTSEDVIVALDDKDVYVRRDAVKLSAQFLKDDASLVDRLAKLVDDEEVRVRFEIPLALGETDDSLATTLLAKLALRDGGDSWFATAILTATKQRSGSVLARLVGASPANDRLKPGLQHIHLVRELATVVGARGDLDELGLVLQTIGGAEQSGVWWQNAALSGLATGLPRHQGALGRISLPKLLAAPPDKLADAIAPVRALLERTADVALDGKSPAGDRVAAIELLGYQPFDQSASAYENLLAANQPVEVQLACVDAMQKSGNDGAAKIVLQHWPTLGPRVRPPALGLLLRRTGTTQQALEAMVGGQISPAIIDIDQRVRLLRHADASIKALSEKLFGGAVSANRREVAEQYTAALTMKSSAAEGMKLFDRVCAKCHRIDGRGHEVGPDISDVRNRSRDALLYDILDPNQKLEPRFTDYLVVTDDGRIFNGLMVSETAEAVVLRQPEGKELTIARNEIEELRGSGKSLMPEGVEKELTVQQMADLLEYLKGNRPEVGDQTGAQ